MQIADKFVHSKLCKRGSRVLIPRHACVLYCGLYRVLYCVRLAGLLPTQARHNPQTAGAQRSQKQLPLQHMLLLRQQSALRKACGSSWKRQSRKQSLQRKQWQMLWLHKNAYSSG
jgi:hypothetical protein